MKQKLDSDVGRPVYKMRKAIVERYSDRPGNAGDSGVSVFRGLENVRAEWQLVCLTTHPEVVPVRRRIQATGGLNRSQGDPGNTESADENTYRAQWGLPQSHLMASV